MSTLCRKTSRLISISLAMSFLAAQFVTLAHAYGHDPGNSQNPVCSSCIAGQSLNAACVDTPAPQVPEICKTGISSEREYQAVTTGLPHARQRAPPSPL